MLRLAGDKGDRDYVPCLEVLLTYVFTWDCKFGHQSESLCRASQHYKLHLVWHDV